MKVSSENISLQTIKADLVAVGIFADTKLLRGEAAVVDKKLNGLISRLIKSGEFKGKLGKVKIIHSQGKIPADKIAVVGLGKPAEFGLEESRFAAAAVIVAAKEGKASKVATTIFGSDQVKLEIGRLAQAVAEGAILGSYEFSGYHAPDNEDEESPFVVKELSLIIDDKNKIKAVDAGLRIGQVLAEAENNARDLVNAPANLLTPTKLAEAAKKLAKELGLKCAILDPKKEKMGALWSVAKGSTEPPKVVVLWSTANSKPAPEIALLGKGITFDSGGISLKPAKKMWEMKTDMAGAAAVLQTMRAIKLLGINKNIVAIMPLSENMPDGSASRPGDIVTSLSGKTIEIISTDAEGRMLLADVITYAKKLKAKQLITVATLTGGCVIALGDVASGVMSNDEKFMTKYLQAAERSGEKMWRLPLYKEYKEYIKSSVADMKNSTETGKASPSSGAIFLQNFVEKTPWIHIDIAGTAYLSKGRGYLDEGATGIPVRTLVELIKGDE